MWNDVETTIDYLHFSVISKTISELIIESGEDPISIGVSGSWGSGKSSMVKMIGKNLMESNEDNDKYIFIEFNAWLYQGYEDAKSALLQVVSKTLADEIKKRKILDTDDIGKKFKKFVKRINWFQVAKMTLPLMAGLIPGSAPFGTIASLVGAIKGSIGDKKHVSKNSKEIEEAFNALTPELEEIMGDETADTTTQQIEEIRNEFEEILTDLDIELVILVDDLDRCLPETAISTLEAMRLLLFVKHTAFIIAADEEMIRNGVRAHFGEVELSEGLVTSYFDKLIQVPITVPRLGVPEIKIYMVLLFLELQVRKGNISQIVLEESQGKLEQVLANAWCEKVTKEKICEQFDEDDLNFMKEYISIADQIAGILVSADSIKGNPRLIKRFLNALEIRKKIATLNGITIDSSVLIKMLLFERCAPIGAFDYLSREVAKTENGKPEFIGTLEDALAKGTDYKAPDMTWNNDFIKEWILLEPRLSEYDLRPMLYLSKDKSLSYAAYDEVSEEGKKVLESLKCMKNGPLMKDVIKKIELLGSRQAELILNHMISLGRGNQWNLDTLFAAVHVVQAFPELGTNLATALDEIPASARKAPMVPVVVEMEWAQELIQKWLTDDKTPQQVKKSINQHMKKEK